MTKPKFTGIIEFSGKQYRLALTEKKTIDNYFSLTANELYLLKKSIVLSMEFQKYKFSQVEQSILKGLTKKFKQ